MLNATDASTGGDRYIFITGAPGSKWSVIARAISEADEIDNSDSSVERAYGAHAKLHHFGNYFGPGMEFGADFDSLDKLGKEDIVRELEAPFAAPHGRLLLKSHMFARHLPLLRRLFPQANFVLVYRSDAACVKWWVAAGGFSIAFPDYSWYGEMEALKQQIAVDNAAILAFCESMGLRLSRYRKLDALAAALGLTFSRDVLTPRAGEEAPAGEPLHRSASLARLAWL